METNTGYRKSYYFQNLHKQMKKDLHYTDKQMYKHFPTIGKMKENEENSNGLVEWKIVLAKIDRGIEI